MPVCGIINYVIDSVYDDSVYDINSLSYDTSTMHQLYALIKMCLYLSGTCWLGDMAAG